MRRTADEIRAWQIGEPRRSDGTALPSTPVAAKLVGAGELFFRHPQQSSNIPGMDYLRCANEQRVIVETEMAAQLAELNATLREMLDVLTIITGKLAPGPGAPKECPTHD